MSAKSATTADRKKNIPVKRACRRLRRLATSSCCCQLPAPELKSMVAGATVRVTVTFALPLLFL